MSVKSGHEILSKSVQGQFNLFPRDNKLDHTLLLLVNLPVFGNLNIPSKYILSNIPRHLAIRHRQAHQPIDKNISRLAPTELGSQLLDINRLDIIVIDAEPAGVELGVAGGRYFVAFEVLGLHWL
jgi:hypothetical protein